MKILLTIFSFFIFTASLLFSQQRSASLTAVTGTMIKTPAVASIDTLHYINSDPVNYTVQNGGGYVNGTNKYGDLGKYQRFNNPGSVLLQKVSIAIGKKALGGEADNVKFVVRSTAPGGAPADLLWSADVSMNNITASSWNTVTLATPVVVTDSFFVGLEWETTFNDTIAILSELHGNGGGRAWEKWSNGSYGKIMSTWSGIDYDLWIMAIVDDVVPVELTSFTASAGKNGVQLKWATATELNNKGFEVERSTSGKEFVKVGFVEGFGTTAEAKNYSFTDNSAASGKYSYRLKQIDMDGSFEYSQVVEVEAAVPSVFALNQNFPNPFNPTTKISFSLAADAKVNVKIFNLLGQQVAQLVNSNMPAGSHEVNFNASNLNSGVYFYSIEAAGADGSVFSSVKKMTLTK